MALSFDGVGNYVDYGNLTAFNGAANASGCVWVNLNAAPVLAGFVDKSVAAGARTFTFSLGASVGTNVALIFDGANRGTTSSGSFSTGEWAHWAFVYDGTAVGDANRLQIYKNGISQTLTFTGAIPATMTASTGSVRSARNTIDGVFANGFLSHVKLWSATLSVAEIVQESQSYRPVRTGSLVLWSPYDDGVAAGDYSGNGNFGTVTGATKIGSTTDEASVGYGFPTVTV